MASRRHSGRLPTRIHVFLSHASEDEAVTRTVLKALEASELPCWFSPRDSRAGEEYGPMLVAAMERARVCVVIFSRHTERSSNVHSEIVCADNAHIPIILFPVDDARPSPEGLGYFLNRFSWLGGSDEPSPAQMEALVSNVRRSFHQEAGTGRQPRPARLPKSTPDASAPGRPRRTVQQRRARAIEALASWLQDRLILVQVCYNSRLHWG